MSVDYYAYSILIFMASLIGYNRQEDKEDSSWQKLMKLKKLIVACLGLVFILQRPLAEAIKCYKIVLGCGDPVGDGDHTAMFNDQFKVLNEICKPSAIFMACT